MIVQDESIEQKVDEQPLEAEPVEAPIQHDLETSQEAPADQTIEAAEDTSIAKELNVIEPAAGNDTPSQTPTISEGRIQDAQAFMFNAAPLMEGRAILHSENLFGTEINPNDVLDLADHDNDVMKMLLHAQDSASSITAATTTQRDYEFRDITGTNNNIDNPNWGSSNNSFLSIAGLKYGDGISTPNDIERPNARDISNTIFAQSTDIFSSSEISNFLWVWGQFVDHDITLTREGDSEAYNISIPQGDVHFDPFGTGQAEIHFKRSAAADGTGENTPREHVNNITSFIDASNVYGSDEDSQLALRAEGGKMLTSGDDLLPLIQGDHGSEFLAGDVRANENIGLTSMHTIFVREHNRLVDLLSEQTPEMTDEQLYQTAKMIVEGEMQKITFDEFLTKLLGEDAITDYEMYDSTIDPTMATEFSTAAFRVGHTMLSSDIFRMTENGNESEFGHLTLRDAFFRPDIIMTQGGIDEALRGLASSGSQEIDSHVIDDVRNFLFGPPGAGGFDLVSLNIQRGRDHGIADFNTVREAYGLDPIKNFFALTNDVDLAQRLTNLYGDISNLDLWVGGLIEAPFQDGLVGETFHIMILEQFTRLRDGDRFWYENRLEDDLLDIVENSSLSDIIARNSDIDYLQNDIFQHLNRIGGDDQDNTINGTNSSDLLIGFDGNDILNGGEGADELYGGNGADIFVFSKSSSASDKYHHIGDFNGLEGDRINLTDILYDYDANTDLLSDFIQVELVNDGTMLKTTNHDTQTSTNIVFLENVQNFDLNWVEAITGTV
ncbi:MAG: peroxidase family protein [Bdellovibrionales bacterium]